MLDSLKLCTWNTTGLGGRPKRNLVLREVLSWNADIIFLQEIRAKANDCTNSDGWLGEEFTAVWDAFLSQYCAILVCKGLFQKVKVILITERCLVLEATCRYFLPSESNDHASQLVHLTCVYAPAKPFPRKAFFDDNPIWRVIPDLVNTDEDLPNERFDIVAGDFNDFPHPQDIYPTNLAVFIADRKWVRYIGPLFSSKGIVDPLREIVSTIASGQVEDEADCSLEEPPFYTRRQANPPRQSRLDHILLSRTFGRLFTYSTDRYYSLSSSTLSDHLPLFLHLQKPATQEAPLTADTAMQKKWTLHPYWLHESQISFRQMTESYIRLQSRTGVVKERISKLSTATAHERWSTYKSELIDHVKWLTRTLPRAVVPGSNVEKQWKEAEAVLESLIHRGQLGSMEYMQQKSKVQEIHDMVLSEERCRLKDRYNSLQQVPSNVISRTHARSKKKQITSLRDVNGVAQHNQQEMLLVAFDYYTSLYARPRVDFHALADLMKGGRTQLLSPAQCRQIVKPFTSQELLYAAKKLNDKSMPGEDGLPTIFFTTFPQALDELTMYCNRVLQGSGETFVPNTPELHVSLLPKKNDISDLRNRRPIALINTCDRIASASFASRYNSTKIAHAILPPNQTAYVKGRIIFDSILCIQLFISASLLGLTREDQAIIFLDQEKAFDRLAQKFIIKTLKSYGLPKQILRWYEKLWDGAEAQYKINGQLTDKVPIMRGVLQGGPDSALVYCMSSYAILEYLSRFLVAFAYYSLSEHSTRLSVDTPAYADDWAVVISQESTVPFFQCMHLAERSAGTRINEDKTSYLFLPARSSSDGPIEPWTPSLPFGQIDSTADYRYLGAFVRGDGQAATESHLKLISDSRRGMHKWQNLTLSWYGRVKLINTFYLSKLWHALGSAGGINEVAILRALHSNLVEIIFGTKTALIRLSTLSMPYIDGGLNLLSPTHMLISMAGRDLIRSLSGITHSSTLFRECLEAQSQVIGLNSTAWLERNHRAWIDRRKEFQPMWLRLAKAAEILDLTACPNANTLDQLLLSPWFQAGIFKYKPSLTPNQKYRIRIARLLTWNDILCDNPAAAEHLLIPLEYARSNLQAATSIPLEDRRVRRSGLNTLHDVWPSILAAMKDEWKLALRRNITVYRPQRHWLSPDSYIEMKLPPHLLLAGVSANQYSVHIARRYQTNKKRDKEILPSRHRPREHRKQYSWDHHNDNLHSSSESSESESDEVATIPEDATIRQEEQTSNTLDEAATISQDQDQDQRRVEANKFFGTLDKCMRRLKLTPEVYSSVYRVYRGSLPYFDASCCKDERPSRIHRLFSCCRATRVWLHMQQVANSIGLTIPTLSQGECTELFPQWLQWNTAQKYRRKQWAAEAKTTEAQLKMHLIASHTHVLVKFMFKPVADEEGEIAACIKQIKALLLEFPYIQEQIELTHQLQEAASRIMLDQEEYDDQESDSEYDQNDQEGQGRLEANGEMNYWDCY